jgi:hypothetical protein
MAKELLDSYQGATIMRNSKHPAAVVKRLAVVGATFAVFSFGGPLDAAEQNRATSTRSGASVSRGTSDVRSPSGTSSVSSSRRASVTRSGSRSNGSKAHRGKSSPPRRHYSDSYYHRNYWGAYFGFYPWGYYGHYSSLYYPVFPTLYYGPYPGEYRDYRLGALDLNVKPKKTEVWVDGQLVGRSGKFDGFPGYLWLGRGRHELIFFNPGFATEVREVRVLEGTVIKVNLSLEAGESVAPETLARKDISRRQQRPRRPATSADKQLNAPTREQRRAPTEPGRILLSVAPGDASVYLDGRFLGTGEELSKLHAGLVVNAGLHTLEVVRPGFRAERTEVVIEPDTETAISVDLESG